MANQITFGATITPATAPMEVTINAGSTFTALSFATVGSNQQGTLTGVPAATYAMNTVGMRAVGYPGTVLYNTAAITVTAAAASSTQTITATSATPA